MYIFVLFTSSFKCVEETKLLSTVCLVSMGFEQEINLDDLESFQDTKVGQYDAPIYRHIVSQLHGLRWGLIIAVMGVNFFSPTVSPTLTAWGQSHSEICWHDFDTFLTLTFIFCKILLSFILFFLQILNCGRKSNLPYFLVFGVHLSVNLLQTQTSN